MDDTDAVVYDYDNSPYMPAVNTYVTPDDEGYTPPFNHLQRLADKLFGAVELNIDAALGEARIKKAMDDARMREVSGQVAILPPTIASWVSRNYSTLFTMAILGGVFFLGSLMLRR